MSHDDNAEESFLRACAGQTEQIWKATFGTEWRKQGGMARGEPPAWYWSDRNCAAAAAPSSTPRLPVPWRTGPLIHYAVMIVGRIFGAVCRPPIIPLPLPPLHPDSRSLAPSLVSTHLALPPSLSRPVPRSLLNSCVRTTTSPTTTTVETPVLA